MQKLNRFLSAFLALAMLFGMAAVPTEAADNGYQFAILDVQKASTSDAFDPVSATSVTSAQKGDVVVVTVGFQNSTSSSLQMGAYNLTMTYDTTKLEVYTGTNIFNGAGGEYNTALTGWMCMVNAQKDNDYVLVNGITLMPTKVDANDSIVLGRFAFQVKSDAADGTARFAISSDTTKSFVSDPNDHKVPLDGALPFNLAIENSEVYKVVWLDGDGSQLDSKEYEAGQAEPTTDKVPVKDSDDNYTYTFSAWILDTTKGNVKTYQPKFTTAAKDISREYQIESVSVKSVNGSPVSAIPSGKFLATVAVKRLTSGSGTIVVLSSYTSSSKFRGLLYVQVDEAVGATTYLTIPVENPSGDIASVRAFAISSFDDLRPLGNAVSFPAV